jgi:hypothetical protein
MTTPSNTASNPPTHPCRLSRSRVRKFGLARTRSSSESVEGKPPSQPLNSSFAMEEWEPADDIAESLFVKFFQKTKTPSARNPSVPITPPAALRASVQQISTKDVELRSPNSIARRKIASIERRAKENTSRRTARPSSRIEAKCVKRHKSTSTPSNGGGELLTAVTMVPLLQEFKKSDGKPNEFNSRVDSKVPSALTPGQAVVGVATVALTVPSASELTESLETSLKRWTDAARRSAASRSRVKSLHNTP